MQRREQMLVILREMKPKQKGGTAFKKKMHKERSQTETVTERKESAREERWKQTGEERSPRFQSQPPDLMASFEGRCGPAN